MALGPGIDAIVATLDLQLVRLLRQAMGPAAGIGKAGCSLAARATICPRFRIQPTPRIDPRPRVEPTPRIEPRQVVHVRPAERREALSPPAPAEPEHRCPSHSPIEPPWKVLPWENPAPPAPKLKLTIKQPDLPIKGSLLDVFI